jgi:hypothetical protein
MGGGVASCPSSGVVAGLDLPVEYHHPEGNAYAAPSKLKPPSNLARVPQRSALHGKRRGLRTLLRPKASL